MPEHHAIRVHNIRFIAYISIYRYKVLIVGLVPQKTAVQVPARLSFSYNTN